MSTGSSASTSPGSASRRRGPRQTIAQLSGGNQQKALLARLLCTDPKLLLLDEPTRGIDVGAKAEVQTLVQQLADQGRGIVLISSELEDVVEGSTAWSCSTAGRWWASSGATSIAEHRIIELMGAAPDTEEEPDGTRVADGQDARP